MPAPSFARSPATSPSSRAPEAVSPDKVKTLALLRHAKSSWDDPNLDDFDRPLAPRGMEAAKRVGNELKRRKLAFDLVLASPARRVTETIAEVEKGYGETLNARFDPRLYGA